MPKKGHSEEQILRALRQAEAGTRVSEICRGISRKASRSRYCDSDQSNSFQRRKV